MATDVRPPLSGASSDYGDHIRWAAISGRWRFENAITKYEGPSDAPGPNSYGIAVTNQHLTDGVARVSVRFSRITGSAGLLLGFHSEQRRYVVAQLGGYKRAYSIAEFDPAVGWAMIDGAGSAQNLQPQTEYHLELKQTGQRVHLSVDGVSVLHTVLARPLVGSQLGLFVWDKDEVAFGQLEVHSTRAKVFVAMQFSQPYDTLYQEVILPTAKSLDLSVVRIDEIAGPGIIFEDIKREIVDANIVIAEITAPNQNVFYELGYAHALKKPTILLAQRGKELPFDIQSYRVIFYDDSIGGKPALERNLRKHFEAILSDS